VRQALRDAGVAVTGFGIVFALVYLAGRVFLPGGGIEISAALPEPTTPVSAPSEEMGSSAPTLDDLHAMTRLMDVSGGVAYFSGVVEGQFVLDRVDVLDEFAAEASSGFLGPVTGTRRGIPVNMDVRFAGEGATLRVIADGVGVGEPRQDEMTVVINAGLLGFTAVPGQCTLEVFESSHSVRSSPVGGIPVIRSFLAQIVCRDLVEIRNGGVADFMAVFALVPGP